LAGAQHSSAQLGDSRPYLNTDRVRSRRCEALSRPLLTHDADSDRRDDCGGCCGTPDESPRARDRSAVLLMPCPSPAGSKSNSAHASRPSESIKDLAEDSCAHHASGKVTGEINSARGSAICGSRPAHESGDRCLRKERADPDQEHARPKRHSRAEAGALANQPPRSPMTLRGSGEFRASLQTGRREGSLRRRGGTRNRPTHLHHANGQWRANQHEVHVCECANEGEQNAKADRECRAQPAVAQVLDPGLQGG
jgi:hypothetical protein